MSNLKDFKNLSKQEMIAYVFENAMSVLDKRKRVMFILKKNTKRLSVIRQKLSEEGKVILQYHRINKESIPILWIPKEIIVRYVDVEKYEIKSEKKLSLDIEKEHKEVKNENKIEKVKEKDEKREKIVDKVEVKKDEKKKILIPAGKFSNSCKHCKYVVVSGNQGSCKKHNIKIKFVQLYKCADWQKIEVEKETKKEEEVELIIVDDLKYSCKYCKYISVVEKGMYCQKHNMELKLGTLYRCKDWNDIKEEKKEETKKKIEVKEEKEEKKDEIKLVAVDEFSLSCMYCSYLVSEGNIWRCSRYNTKMRLVSMYRCENWKKQEVKK